MNHNHRNFGCLAVVIINAFAVAAAWGQAAPYSHTLPARLIYASHATFSGMASPNGSSSLAWFEWGTNNTFSQQTATSDVGNGNGVVCVNATVSGLVQGGTYSCRLVVSNVNGVAQGLEQRFTTGKKVALWPGSATNWPADLTNAISLASRGAHYLAIMNDGSVAAWGSNTYGESSVPASATNVAAVSCGGRHSLALLADTKVLAWGENSLGQTSVPASLSNVVSIATGEGHNLALKSDGTVAGWGQNEFGQANVPSGLTNVVEVACGGWCSVALKNDGTLVGWGDGGNGQLTFPAELTNVVAIGAGDHMSVELQRDGTVWALGAVGAGGGWTWINFSGTLSGPGNTIAIAAGGDSVIGLGNDGMLTNWGNAPVTPPGLTDVANISSGWLALAPNVPPQTLSQTNSGLANLDLPVTLTASDVNGDPLTLRVTVLPTAGTLYQYNNGARGPAITAVNTAVSDAGRRLIFAPATDGDGSPYASFSFVANDGQSDSPTGMITFQINGAAYAMSLPATAMGQTNATLNGVATPQGLATSAWFEWGTNDSYGFASDPVSLGGGTNMIRLNTVASNLALGGIYHSRLVASNSASVTTGFDQIFTTGRNVTQFQYDPLPSGISGVTMLSVGGSHTMVMRNDGSLFVWGGPANVTNIPAGISNVVQVSAGGGHCLALRNDGWVYGWGTNSSGQISYANSSFYGWGANVVQVSAGGAHSVALKADGTVSACGNWTISAPPAGLNQVVAIAAGASHSLALKNDGTVAGWGDNGWGQANPPAGLSNVVAVAAGGYHNLALRSDGSVAGWGFDYYGEATIPEAVTNVVAIAAGEYHSVALRRDGTVIAWGYNRDAYNMNNHGQATVPAGLNNVAGIEAGGLQTVVIGNLAPVANALSVAGPANHDLLVTLPRTDANGDVTTAQVVSLPATGALYQYDSGNRGDLIATADTWVSDLQGRVWFVPDTNSHGVTTFGFLVNDGWTNSAPATVTVNITASARAFTGPQTFLNSSNVILNGWGTGGGLPASTWFEWGTNSAFGQKTAPQALDTDLAGTRLSATLANLMSGGEFHYRLVVSNAAMVASGAETVYTTGSAVRAWGVNSAGQVEVPALISSAMAVAGGAEHSLALLSDTTVAGWGRNDAGQANPPDGLTNVTAMAAGLAHSLALRADGTVIAWGTNNYSQTNPPDGLSDVLAMAAGANHNLALKTDGTVVSWGLNTSSQTNVPGGLNGVVSVAAGWAHSLALRFDGTLLGWGNNGYGQITVSGLSNIVAIAASGNHTLALKSNGTVSGFGSNGYGESTVPAAATNVIAIAAGTNQSFALRRDGSVISWGRNDLGQSSVPANVSACLGIAGGNQHALALTPTQPLPFAATEAPGPVRLNGAVLRGLATANGAGATAWFEWGTNSIFSRTTPPLPLNDGGNVRLITNSLSGLKAYTAYCSRLVVSNSVGVVTGRTVFFATGGRLRSWGTAAGGQTNVSPALAGTVGMSAGTGHAMAVFADGSVAAWGTNTYSQLNVPSAATNILSVAAGGYHSLALNSGGRVIAWGRYLEGQTNVPATLSNVLAIAAGDRHSLALRSDGGVVAWGYNGSGQINVPAWLTNVVAIAASGNLSVALKQDGVAVIWGSPATLPSGANNLTAIAASTNNVLLLKADGRVTAWGNNSYDQTNVPPSISNAVDVAMGERHGNVLKTDRTVAAWMGYEPGYYGETNVPSGLTNVVCLKSAGLYNLALVAGTTPPQVFAMAPGPVTPTSATLSGALVLNDLAATTWFEWGTNGAFTQATAAMLIGSTNYIVFTNAPLAGLAPGGNYSYRLAASNSVGISRSTEQRFTTGRKMLAWGYNNYGQTNIPVGLTNVVAVAGGQYHSAALLNDGKVRVWGYSGYSLTNVPGSATNVIAIASGYNHLLVLRSNHTVVTWGNSASGLGAVPAAATNIVAIACGKNHSLALRADGRMVAWGENGNGQTTIPANLSDVVAIAGGGAHSLALRADGSVRAWGYNSSGQTNVPVAASNLVAVTAGDNFSIALRADSTAVSWGGLSLTSNNTNLIAITAGLYLHVLGLKTNGTVVGWGNNSYGQVTFSAGGVTTLGAGYYHSLAVGPNAPPTATPQTYIGAANQDLVITPTATDPNGDQINYRVATLPVAGALYQYAGGGGRGAAILSPETPVTDGQGRLLFAPGNDESGWLYATFNVAANDGEADSAPAAETINIIFAPMINTDSTNVLSNGMFTVNFTGDSNATYRVWSSTNLVGWSVLGSAEPTAPGVFQYRDTAATNAPQQFYRVTCP